MKSVEKFKKDFSIQENSFNQKEFSLDEIKKSLSLRSLMREKLIDSYTKELSVKKEEINEEELKIWCELKNINSEEELSNWKKTNFINDFLLNEIVEKDLKWRLWCLQNYRNAIDNEYLNADSEIEIVDYSLIRTKNFNLANELYLRITEKEETFESIAEKFSEGEEKYNRGRIGPIQIGKSHPSIALILKKSSKGKVCEPIEIESWWVIIRVNDYQKNFLDNNQKMKIALSLGEKLINKNLSNIII